MTRTEMPDDARVCPECKGEGEVGETRYQPVEGMAYLDAPKACPVCTPPLTRADYPSGPRPRGWLTEDEYREYCREQGVCWACPDFDEANLPEPGFTMCGPCSAEAAADERFHEAHNEGLI